MLAALLDLAPEPVSIGVALAVVLFVIAVVILLTGALVFFLWYRKRSLRHQEMVRTLNSSSRSGSGE
jgi:hypothetical protein